MLPFGVLESRDWVRGHDCQLCQKFYENYNVLHYENQAARLSHLYLSPMGTMIC
jgi:hypothetical protein